MTLVLSPKSAPVSMVMYGGMVMETADVETIFNNPKHPYTMGLLKSNPQD